MILFFRRLVRFALFFAFFFQVINSEAQNWQKHAKSGNGALNDIVFVSKAKGFALGYGKVLKTTDTGKTWTQILSGYSKFSRIMFADPSTGYIIGYNDLVLKTTDGGDNWSLKRTGNSDDDLITLFPKDKDTIYVLGPDDLDNNKYGNYLEYSYNGGNTWSRKSTGSTNTIRSMYMWNKNRGQMGSLTGGIFKTTDGFTNYNVDWNANNIIDTRSIQDSVVVMVGLNGKIYRSSNYGDTWKSITSPTSENLLGVHFADDSIGMACGEKGIILYTADGGLSWSKMVTNTKMTIWKVFVINKYYAWAAANSSSGDSMDIMKFGSQNFVANKINIIKGSIIADVIKNCQKDNKETGPSEILVKVEPGPYYTYTLSNGQYEIVIPDTGKYTVKTFLPNKYGGNKNLCDTSGYKLYFKTFENTTSNNFYFKADSSIKLEINISTSRKRRCAVNSNTITYKNMGFKTVDSAIVELIYSPYVDIVKADRSFTKKDGKLIFKTGPLLPGQGGNIIVLDSVLCNNPNIRGAYACMRVLITPKIFVEKQVWDSSRIRAKIDCHKDSLAIIKLYNDGTKKMNDSAKVDLYLDGVKVVNKNYLILPHDSLKLEMEPKGKSIFLETNLGEHHPYLEHIRVFNERCGDSAGFYSKFKVTQYALQEFPAFEEEICIEIRDSYDPNDISVIPQGMGSKHYIKNEDRLRYIIRFQNTGNDTAINITVIDTLPSQLDIASLEMLGASHNYKYSFANGNKKNVLKIDFKKIMLVDSFANEKLSHGYISFDVKLKDKLPKGTRVENFVDIYFDYNDPVRTNTVFNTIHDTVFTKLNPKIVKNCMSRFLKVPGDSTICNTYSADVSFKTEGLNTPVWMVDNAAAKFLRKNDSIGTVSTPGTGRFELSYALPSCENIWYDTTIFRFGLRPTISVKDSLYCGSVNDNINFTCFSCNYLWSTGYTGSDLYVNKPAKYWVQVNNLCGIISDTFKLSTLPYVNLELGKDTLLCNNSTLVLTKNIGSGNYSWNDGSQANNKTISQEGKYILTYQDQCNFLKDSITVLYKKTPSIGLGKDSIYCVSVNHPLSLDSVKTKYTISWWDGSTVSSKTLTSAGKFHVTLSNECGSASDTLNLGVLNIPKADLGRDSIYCNPFIRTVNINKSDYDVLWWDGSNALSRQFDTPGTYSVKVFNRCGEATDDLKLSRAWLPDFDLGNDTTYCQNFSRKLDATSPGAIYTWSTGDTSRFIFVSAAGTYSVKASSYCGSLSRTIKLFQNSRPHVDLGKDIALEKPFDILLDAGNPGNSYIWNTTETSQMIRVNDYGNYWVKASNICGSSIDTIIISDPLASRAGEKVLVFPNPITGAELQIIYLGGDYSLELFDQFGQLVLDKIIARRQYSLSMEDLSKGVYYLRVMQGEQHLDVVKVVKP